MSEGPKYPEVYKVIGAPGTGKTTRVVGNPELDLDGLFIENGQEYSLDEQMLVTYTNAGVDEAADRLEKMLNAPRYKIDERITTIHGQCYRILGLEREQVVQHWNKKKFCDAFDLDFGWDDDSDDIMAADKAEGNALFDLYGWLQSNRMQISQWQECPAGWEGEEDPEWLMNKWDEWKQDKGLVGFGDMIEYVLELGYKQCKNLGWGVLFPDETTTTREMFTKARWDEDRDPSTVRGKGAFIDTKVLYVDEVQDLTPLQWEFYLLQKLAVEKVYIGGDDDQTIYGWAGANPNFMLDEEGDFEVLDKTYRIPEEIWSVCDEVIHQVDKRQEKAVEPHGDGGEFATYRAPAPRQIISHLEDGECMVLFRARYQIDEFRDYLHEFGIPYRNMSTYDTWSDDIVKLRDALAKLGDPDSKVKGDEMDMMIEYAEDEMLRRNSNVSEEEKVMGQLGGISTERLEEIFRIEGYRSEKELTATNYLMATEELNYYEKEAIRGNLQSGNVDMYPDRIRIGTIHSSKGKEAPTVVLATDSTQTILDNMRQEVLSDGGAIEGGQAITDAERRVYYVGMTRASEKLVLAQGIIDPSLSIDLTALLGESYEPEEWESGQTTVGRKW